ncbi:hypothetical protein T492DRAFT_1009616 [Pavlovales sp. CCMP2436]|nr:hypothetical protein T492DRAFT_1009616 [Pavlovales sp. CCMP2436]|mmetsp:Transcript_12696/g.32159  ORF Transcript_12696/g.32159 Transcript_12696/m.32159 type:complete len:207 (+) Transcript_12696:146-766(+)
MQISLSLLLAGLLALLGLARASGLGGRARVSLSAPTQHLRPGAVLVAQPDQFDHFLHEAVLLVCEHGPGGGRGVLLNRETPFTMGEMAEGMGCFSTSIVYRGGGAGADTVLMLHSVGEVQGAKPLGDSGLFLGGLASARELVGDGRAPAASFKFFFKSEIWAPGELELQLERQVWWAVDGATADEVIAARGDRALHSNWKKRFGLG